MTLDDDRALTSPDYWDDRYAKGEGHEWFRSFEDLESFFHTNLFEKEQVAPQADPLLLHLGSGDSVIPAELASRGYARQICVDFSPVVVDMMAKRHAKIPGIEWKQADVRNMDMLADKSIDVALDKSTLDAMVYGSGWNPLDEVKSNTSRYMRELHRVLKDDSLFLYITFRPAHFIRPLLNPDGRLWDIDMQTLESDKGTFPYYGYVIQKRTAVDSEDAPAADAKDTAPNGADLEEGRKVLEERDSDQASDDSSEVDPDNLGSLFS